MLAAGTGLKFSDFFFGGGAGEGGIYFNFNGVLPGN